MLFVWWFVDDFRWCVWWYLMSIGISPMFIFKQLLTRGVFCWTPKGVLLHHQGCFAAPSTVFCCTPKGVLLHPQGCFAETSMATLRICSNPRGNFTELFRSGGTPPPARHAEARRGVPPARHSVARRGGYFFLYYIIWYYIIFDNIIPYSLTLFTLFTL